MGFDLYIARRQPAGTKLEPNDVHNPGLVCAYAHRSGYSARMELKYLFKEAAERGTTEWVEIPYWTILNRAGTALDLAKVQGAWFVVDLIRLLHDLTQFGQHDEEDMPEGMEEHVHVLWWD